MRSLKKNSTQKLVDRSREKRIIGCKWVYKQKPRIPGVELAQFKARIDVKGYSKIEQVDYHKVFSPVVKHSSIRLILAMVVVYDLELE